MTYLELVRDLLDRAGLTVIQSIGGSYFSLNPKSRSKSDQVLIFISTEGRDYKISMSYKEFQLLNREISE